MARFQKGQLIPDLPANAMMPRKQAKVVRETRETLARQAAIGGTEPPAFRKGFVKEHGFEYPYETPAERMKRQRREMREYGRPYTQKE